jgi:pimeloyl-ACP methyl ester carboxylesterase
LSIGRWASVATPTVVMVGEKSEPFFHTGARELAKMLPNAQYRSLAGGNHGAVLFSAKALATELEQFYLGQR